MRDREKLLRKISKKERQALLAIMDVLLGGNHKGLAIKKLKGSDFYRLRKGVFRIIFHYNEHGDAIIDSIRLRKEDPIKIFSTPPYIGPLLVPPRENNHPLTRV